MGFKRCSQSEIRGEVTGLTGLTGHGSVNSYQEKKYMETTAAIVLAAGQGKRMESKIHRIRHNQLKIWSPQAGDAVCGGMSLIILRNYKTI